VEGLVWRDTTTDHLAVLLGMGLSSYVKAPLRLVGTVNPTKLRIMRELIWDVQTIERRLQCCVAYWGETISWQTPSGTPSTEERAVLEHLQKFFNHCTAEWLWIDVLAIPEVYKDMSEVEKEKTEEVRV
jgi:hypothetical protein